MSTPGLSFEIVRASTPVLGLRSDRTAIIALMERGPVETPVMVHSYDELVERFGGPLDGALGAIAAQGYFDNGGEQLLVTRFFPGEAGAETAAAALLAAGADRRRSFRANRTSPSARRSSRPRRSGCRSASTSAPPRRAGA